VLKDWESRDKKVMELTKNLGAEREIS